MQKEFNYWAFVSYSHQDNLEQRRSGESDCVRWGEWLHKGLESYRVPKVFGDRITPTGEAMPTRFFPVFQDEKELPLNSDLAGAIAEGLELSRFLIVICTPRSAASFYVNEEVRRFKLMGRQDRILALIVAGEPNASDGNKAGYTVEDECFCPALRHPLDENGEVDTTRRDAQEPIAGDVRVKLGHMAREARRADLRSHREVLEFMRLKLLARLMGVGFDELVQRDKARQAAEFRRRVAILAGVTLAIAGLAVYALIERGNAIRGEQRIAENASRSHYDLSKLLFERQDDAAALAHLAESLRNNPRNQVATSYALNLLLHREWSIPMPNPIVSELWMRGAVLSPDGRLMLTSEGEEKLFLWVAATGEPRGPDLVSEGDVLSADFSSDSQRVIATSADGVAHIWEAETGKVLKEFQVPGKLPALWLSDEKRILTLTKGESARLWEASTGQPLSPPLDHPELAFTDVSPDGTRILTASTLGSVQVWDAGSGAKIGGPLQHGEILFAASFSIDGTKVITGASDGFARVWEVATGAQLGEMKHADPLWFAHMTAAGDRIVTRTTDGEVQLGEGSTFQPWAGPIVPGGRDFGATVSVDGSRLLVPGSGRLTIWNVATGRELAEPVLRQNLLTSADLSADESRVVTSGWEGSVRLWDARTGKAAGEAMKHTATATSAVFSPDGTRVVSTSWDGTVKVWNTGTGEAVASWPMEERANRAVFSPNGALVAAGDSQGNVRLFNVAGGETVHEMVPSRKSEVNSLDFSPDGKRLVTAGGDFLAHVWDVETGKEIVAKIRHESSISSAVFSPDGRHILTSSSDRTARIWDVETGAPVIDAVQLGDWGYGARFSPDGARFVTAARDGTVRVWDSANGQPLADFGPLSGKFALGVDALSAEFYRDGRGVFVVMPAAIRRMDVAGYDTATEDLARLVESLGGWRLEAESGRMAPVPEGRFEALRTSFSSDGNGEVAEVGEWFFSDRRTRAISPWSRMTFPEWTARRLSDEAADVPAVSLEELLAVDPSDPSLLITLAGKLRETEPARSRHYIDLVRMLDPGFPIPADLLAPP